jgi:hypothetical protein
MFQWERRGLVMEEVDKALKVSKTIQEQLV